MLTLINTTKIVKTSFPENLENFRNSVMPKLTELFKVAVNIPETPVVAGGICSFFNEDGSGKILQTWPEFQSYIEYIRPYVYEYTDAMGYERSRLWLRGMWANEYTTGSYAKKHKHYFDSDVFGVLFYLQKPKDSGDLYLEVPTDDTFEEHKIKITEGDILIIPTQLMHRTDPNLNVIPKIVIGIEIVVLNDDNNELAF